MAKLKYKQQNVSQSEPSPVSAEEITPGATPTPDAVAIVKGCMRAMGMDASEAQAVRMTRMLTKRKLKL